MTWPALLAAAAGCYLFKLAGLSAPQQLLNDHRARSIGFAVPISLLAALAATQTFATGTHLVFDPRAAGFAVALVAVALRAPFVVVVLAATATTALIRLVA
jgi:Branched-chain amino acid transport protein (AzlD)